MTQFQSNTSRMVAYNEVGDPVFFPSARRLIESLTEEIDFLSNHYFMFSEAQIHELRLHLTKITNILDSI